MKTPVWVNMVIASILLTYLARIVAFYITLFSTIVEIYRSVFVISAWKDQILEAFTGIKVDDIMKSAIWGDSLFGKKVSEIYAPPPSDEDTSS